MDPTSLERLLAAPWRRVARWLGLGASGERLLGYVAGLAAVAVASLVIGLVLGQGRIANISMLYLIAIMVTAVTFGRGPAVLASIAAFLTFDFFFVVPVHTFTVADPEEWLALLLFLVTGAVVGALVDDVLGRLRPVTARHRIAARVAEDLPPALLDRVEMDQVLSNLVENAVKYTPPGTAIEVGARVEHGTLRLEVADRGPGIPPEALPHLFGAFYRVDGSARRPTGLGIGLAIVKGLVEAHGGRVAVENRAGGGARFTITLPVEAAGPPLRVVS